MKQLAADEASDDDEFQVLDLKIKINEYYEQNPDEKKIPSELMSEALNQEVLMNQTNPFGKWPRKGKKTCED